MLAVLTLCMSRGGHARDEGVGAPRFLCLRVGSRTNLDLSGPTRSVLVVWVRKE